MSTQNEPLAAAQTIWQRLRCPDCQGALTTGAAGDAGLTCTSCSASYSTESGFADLIGKKSELNQSEVETQDRVADHYDGIRYQRTASVRYHEDTMQQLVQLAPPRGTVLDDGCGTGAFLEFARKAAAGVQRYVGIDVSRNMLKHACRRLGPSGETQLLVRADACRLPFADDSFDVIYARALLHHLPSPEAGLREIRRVLRPGGTAVVLDPNKTLISSVPRYLARRTKHFDDDHKNFRASDLQRWVSAELDISAVRFFGYIAYPLIGFPDLIDFDRLGIARLAGPLIRLDRAIAQLPGVRRLGWGVIISGTKS